jgi:lipopolysaccharide/colanic/teichoic acid biosynthesis glycosyltransferase/glycosyltransferase involved in cell wall biosynthesis
MNTAIQRAPTVTGGPTTGPLDLALYYPWIYLPSGIERTILKILQLSRHRWTVYTSHFDREQTFPELARARVVELRRVPVDRSYPRVAQAALAIVRQKIELGNHDGLLVCTEGLGDLLMFGNNSCPAAALCFTPLRAAFDPLYRQRHLSGHRVMLLPALLPIEWAFKAIDRLAWRRYRRIFCISQEVAQRVARGKLARPEKLEILRPGVDFPPVSSPPVFGRFFLVPGRIMWTKNVELAISAFDLFRRRHRMWADYRLVIAGVVDSKSARYVGRLRKMAARVGNVEFVHFPSDRELEQLYRTCRAVIFPAFNEDWGLVPLEAMAFGKPVVAVNRGGPRESIEHGRTGFLAAPAPEEFAGLMENLAEDELLCQQMGELGREAARQYTWHEFVRLLDENMAEVALQLDDQKTQREASEGGQDAALYLGAKRLFDILLAVGFLSLFSPLLLAVSLLIRLDSPGPALFWQERVGQWGKRFRMLKFRSMRSDSHRMAPKPDNSHDPRITRVGKILRRTAVDELPQIWNVLKGEMSFVGPRPEMPFFTKSYGKRERVRLSVKPGMTCLWQINAPRGQPVHAHLEYDLEYLRRRSFFFDITLLWKTLLFVFSSIGRNLNH